MVLMVAKEQRIFIKSVLCFTFLYLTVVCILKKLKNMQIQLRDKVYDLPTDWAGLDERQKLIAVQLLTTATGSTDAETELAFKRIELLKCLSGFSDAGLLAWEADCIADDPEHGELFFLADLAKKSEAATAFFFEETTEGVFSVAFNLLACPYPKLELWQNAVTTEGGYLSAHGKRQVADKRSFKDRMQHLRRGKVVEPPMATLYAPHDAMDNLDFWELVQLFTRIEAFQKDGHRRHIVELLSQLYRPLLNARVGRVALSDYEDAGEANAAYFEQLPDMVLNLLWFWAVSCQQYFIKNYPSVFQFDYAGGVNDKLEKYGMAGVLMEMAQNDVTKHEAVKRLNAHDVLAQFSYLEDKRRGD